MSTINISLMNKSQKKIVSMYIYLELIETIGPRNTIKFIPTQQSIELRLQYVFQLTSEEEGIINGFEEKRCPFIVVIGYWARYF